MAEAMINVTVRVKPALHEQLGVLVAQKGISRQAAMEEALTTWCIANTQELAWQREEQEA